MVPLLCGACRATVALRGVCLIYPLAVTLAGSSALGSFKTNAGERFGVVTASWQGGLFGFQGSPEVLVLARLLVR